MFSSQCQRQELTSRVEVALAAADRRVLVGEPLVGPHQPLGREHHFVIGLLELPEKLLRPAGKDEVVAAGQTKNTQAVIITSLCFVVFSNLLLLVLVKQLFLKMCLSCICRGTGRNLNGAALPVLELPQPRLTAGGGGVGGWGSAESLKQAGGEESEEVEMFHPARSHFVYFWFIFLVTDIRRREPAGFAHFRNTIRGVDEDQEFFFIFQPSLFS